MLRNAVFTQVLLGRCMQKVLAGKWILFLSEYHGLAAVRSVEAGGGSAYLWLAENQGMEETMETIIIGPYSNYYKDPFRHS